ARDAGVVEEHVDAAVLGQHGGGERARLLLVADVDSVRDAFEGGVEVGGDDCGALLGEEPRARTADAGAGAGDDADLAGEPHGHGRTLATRRASPSAMRMIAPFAASIQNVDVFRSTRTLLTRPSRTTPVNAPSMRPRPPSSAMPPITAAANTVKMRLLPWFAVTATTCPAIISPASAASIPATVKTPMRIRSTLIPAARAASLLPPIA